MVAPHGDITPHRGYNHNLAHVPPGTDLPVPRAREVSLGSHVHPSRMLTYQTPEPQGICQLPKSFAELLNSHRVNGLHTLEGVDKRRWCNKVRVAFSKRHYLYTKIVTRARSLGLATTTLPYEKHMAAAQLLDAERGRRTMTQYLRHLKSLDPMVRRRNVMERDEDGEDTGRRVRARHGYGELEQV